ncbi:MAG: serpin family protein [Saccharofermentanales bacterium]
MKLEDLQDAMGQLDDNIVTEAGKVRRKRKPALRYRVVAVAAAVAIFVTGFIVIQNIRQHGDPPLSPDTSKDHTVMTNISQNEPETTDKPHRAWQTDLVSGIAALAMPEYPVMHEYPSEDLLYGTIDDQEAYNKAHTAWLSDRNRQRYQPRGYQDGVMAFARETNRLLLESDGENRVYSPINVYLAMSLLAETSGGDTRAEILQALGVESIKELRNKVDSLWECPLHG